MRRPRQLVLMLLSVLAWTAVSPARAEDAPAEGPGPAGWLERLGTPAREAGVEEALARVRDAEGPAVALEVAEALGRSGGPEAAEALATLLRHPDVQVRGAVLQGIYLLNLRHPSLAQGVRRVLDARHPDLCEAALEALGRVGDGEDLPRLLSWSQTEEPRLRAAAFHALSELTGRSIPFVHARWAYACRTIERRAAESLPAALLGLERDAEAEDAWYHRYVLERYAWTDLRHVRSTLRFWLSSPNPALRVEACRLAAHLRLADLGSEIGRLSVFAFDDGVEAAAREAMGVLGVADPRAETEAPDAG